MRGGGEGGYGGGGGHRVSGRVTREGNKGYPLLCSTLCADMWKMVQAFKRGYQAWMYGPVSMINVDELGEEWGRRASNPASLP